MTNDKASITISVPKADASEAKQKRTGVAEASHQERDTMRKRDKKAASKGIGEDPRRNPDPPTRPETKKPREPKVLSMEEKQAIIAKAARAE